MSTSQCTKIEVKLSPVYHFESDAFFFICVQYFWYLESIFKVSQKIFVYIQSLLITEAERKLLFPSSRRLTIHSKGDFTHLVGRMVSNLASHCKGLNWVPAVGDLTVLVQKKVS